MVGEAIDAISGVQKVWIHISDRRAKKLLKKIDKEIKLDS